MGVVSIDALFEEKKNIEFRITNRKIGIDVDHKLRAGPSQIHSTDRVDTVLFQK